MTTRKRPPEKSRHAKGAARRRTSAAAAGEAFWIYGRHAVGAALANPSRQAIRLLLATAADDLAQSAAARGLVAERLARGAIDAVLPEAVHQGVALLARPLPPIDLADALAPAGPGPDIALVLDQIADPRNVGAILRSAAAFAARAVIMQDRHAPPESGALAKAASGALDMVPLVRVTNVARALSNLAEAGYWRIGLDAGAGQTIDEAGPFDRTALVLGAEGTGLRRLVREQCDLLLSIALPGRVPSLNVSAAAAIALHAIRSRAGLS